MEMMEHEDISNANLAGHLLVAAPYLEGGGFHHSVIFLSRVEEEFVIGYILNHPANMTVGDVAPSTDIPANPFIPSPSSRAVGGAQPAHFRRLFPHGGEIGASSSTFRRNRRWNTRKTPMSCCAPMWGTAVGRCPSCAGS